jgi:hypothetical protein
MIHDDTTYIDLYGPNLLGPWESEISSKIVENRFFFALIQIHTENPVDIVDCGCRLH